MLKRARTWCLLAWAALVAGCGNPRAEIHAGDYAVAGAPGARELRLLVETQRASTEWPAISCAGTNYDSEKLWFVVAPVEGPGPWRERARLYGPLTAGEGNEYWQWIYRWRLFGLQKGASCIGFDADGNLVRLRRDPAVPELVRERLELTAKGARFVESGRVAPPPAMHMDDTVLECGSQALMVCRDSDGEVRAYRTDDGTVRDDRWLVAAYGDALSREDLTNNRSWLPDADHLIVSPEDDVSLGATSGRPAMTCRAFTLAGQQYDRAKYGVVYTRPDPTPRVFLRPESAARYREDPPFGAFMIDGKLAMFDTDASKLELYIPATPGSAARTVYTRPFPKDAPWGPLWARRVRVNDTVGELAVKDWAEAPGSDRTFSLFVWRYREGLVIQESVPVRSLFHEWMATYQPNNALPVDNR